MDIKFSKSLRASDVSGMPVMSPEGEDIGEIEDVVINLDSGKIAYAVLCFHTWFKDKLFAIPWTELSLRHDSNTDVFVLDTTRKQLKSAPGFDFDDWPDVASDEWREEIDAHYRSD
jgi:sporulation protein YlmC with PRC-barrel domain